MAGPGVLPGDGVDNSQLRPAQIDAWIASSGSFEAIVHIGEGRDVEREALANLGAMAGLIGNQRFRLGMRIAEELDPNRHWSIRNVEENLNIAIGARGR